MFTPRLEPKTSSNPAAKNCREHAPFSKPSSILDRLPNQKLANISSTHDSLEQEADRTANQIMRKPGPESSQALTVSNQQQPITASSNATGSGEKMSSSTRSFFEPRFGQSFNHVRIHNDNHAHALNQSINARAFTYGSDIYFNRNQYRPNTQQGKHLLAHELTHIVQQQHRPEIRRKVLPMRYGQGQTPTGWEQVGFNPRPVPWYDKPVVDEAIARIKRIADNPAKYPSCHRIFNQRCTNKSKNSLKAVFDRAVIWKISAPGTYGVAHPNDKDFGYTQSGHDSGARNLAATIIHELLHLCGLGVGSDHHIGEKAALYCIGEANTFSIAFGTGNAGIGFPFILSYSRLLKALGNGQITWRAGIDLNLEGFASSATPGGTGDIGSLATGLKGRSNLLFGGEQFGGLTARLDAGVGLGNFRLKDAASDARTKAFDVGFLLQAGAGIEFYVPAGDSVIPFSAELMSRTLFPLTQDAKRIQSYILSVGVSL